MKSPTRKLSSFPEVMLLAIIVFFMPMLGTAQEVVPEESLLTTDDSVVPATEGPASEATPATEETYLEVAQLSQRNRAILDDETNEIGQLATTVVTASTLEPRPPRAIPRPVIVDQVVTSATRTEKKIAEVPAAIGVITQEEIARIAPLSFDDLLRNEPNVDALGGPRYLGEQIVIRGQGGNAVTVRIDDARQNFVSGHAGQRFFAEPHFLQEVEILRGGGSYLYGSGSAGVINVSTLDPEDIVKDGNAVGLRIRNEYHTVSEEWANSVIGAVSSEKLDMMIGASGRDANDLTLPDGSLLPGSAYERNSNIAKMVIRPTDEQQITLSVNDYHSLDQGGANPQALGIDGVNAPGVNAPVGREIEYLQWTANYQWNPIGNDLIDLNTTFYYNTTTQTRNYLDTTTANAARTNVHDFSVFGIDIRNRSVIEFGGFEHELVYGMEYVNENQEGDETRATFFNQGIPGTASNRPDAEGEHLAFFLTDEIDVTDQLTLFAGLRFDTYETTRTIGNHLSQSDDALSPNVGFNLEVTDHWSVFGRYSRAFTQPTLNELYQDGSHFGIVPNEPFVQTNRAPQGGVFPAAAVPPPGEVQFNYFEEVFIPNPDLLPETSDIFEFGVSYENADVSGGQLAARVNTFYQRGENTVDSEIVGSASAGGFRGFANPPGTDVPAAFSPPFGSPFNPLVAGFSGINFPGVLTQDFRQAVNRAETEIYGAEFTLDYDHDEWFAGLAAGTIRGQDLTTGLNLNTITGDQVSLTLGIRPLDNLELGAYGIWNGGREQLVSDPTLATAGYDVYGLFANWRVTESWSLRMGVDNLLNQEHQRTNLLLPEPGRNVFFTSTIHW